MLLLKESLVDLILDLLLHSFNVHTYIIYHPSAFCNAVLLLYASVEATFSTGCSTYRMQYSNVLQKSDLCVVGFFFIEMHLLY